MYAPTRCSLHILLDNFSESSCKYYAPPRLRVPTDRPSSSSPIFFLLFLISSVWRDMGIGFRRSERSLSRDSWRMSDTLTANNFRYKYLDKWSEVASSIVRNENTRIHTRSQWLLYGSWYAQRCHFPNLAYRLLNNIAVSLHRNARWHSENAGNLACLSRNDCLHLETVQICTAKCVAQITLDGRLNMFAASCLSHVSEFAINLEGNAIRKKLDLSLLICINCMRRDFCGFETRTCNRGAWSFKKYLFGVVLNSSESVAENFEFFFASFYYITT